MSFFVWFLLLPMVCSHVCLFFPEGHPRLFPSQGPKNTAVTLPWPVPLPPERGARPVCCFYTGCPAVCQGWDSPRARGREPAFLLPTLMVSLLRGCPWLVGCLTASGRLSRVARRGPLRVYWPFGGTVGCSPLDPQPLPLLLLLATWSPSCARCLSLPGVCSDDSSQARAVRALQWKLFVLMGPSCPF